MAAERRVAYAKKLLAEVGLEPERLDMFYLSASQGAYFAEIATEMTERARALGPNPLRTGSDVEAVNLPDEGYDAITS